MLTEIVPLYPLYALLFAATGLTEAQISVLFVLWSVSGMVFEVPSGVLADRFSRRSCLIWAGFIQAAGYLLWIARPDFAGFAIGFLLWSFAGSLTSGAFEALLYDGLARAGAAGHYQRLYGRITSVELLAQLPAAGLATLLFGLGGYPMVGWASVVVCLGGSLVATGFREPPRCDAAPVPDTDALGYLQVLRSGLAQAARPLLRGIIFATAFLGGLDAIEEYFPLLAQGWGIPIEAIPLSLLGIPLAGALGAMFGGRTGQIPATALSVALGAGLVVLAAGNALGRPASVAGIVVFYGLYRWVLVIVESRLQERITGPDRATVTSLAALGIELGGLVLFGLWAVGGLGPVVVGALAVAVLLPRLLRP
ncbi:MFS transporter [Nakamurella silvestris]|nr:MFS transporter [Nakamurella silvestris]